MGFRSMLMSEDAVTTWPAWFIDKYSDMIHIASGGPISSKVEMKVTPDIIADIQRALEESNPSKSFPFRFVALHECGGLSVIDFIAPHTEPRISEPDSLRIVDDISHSYCQECLTPVGETSVREDTESAVRAMYSALRNDPEYAEMWFKKICNQVADAGATMVAARIVSTNVLEMQFGIIVRDKEHSRKELPCAKNA